MLYSGPANKSHVKKVGELKSIKRNTILGSHYNANLAYGDTKMV